MLKQFLVVVFSFSFFLTFSQGNTVDAGKGIRKVDARAKRNTANKVFNNKGRNLQTVKQRNFSWTGYVVGKKTPKRFAKVIQHPIVVNPGPKFVKRYFSLVQRGKWKTQYIAVFKKGTAPKDTSRPIQITGTTRTVKVTNKRNRGKARYQGGAVNVRGWKYLKKTP